MATRYDAVRHMGRIAQRTPKDHNVIWRTSRIVCLGVAARKRKALDDCSRAIDGERLDGASAVAPRSRIGRTMDDRTSGPRALEAHGIARTDTEAVGERAADVVVGEAGCRVLHRRTALSIVADGDVYNMITGSTPYRFKALLQRPERRRRIGADV